MKEKERQEHKRKEMHMQFQHSGETLERPSDSRFFSNESQMLFCCDWMVEAGHRYITSLVSETVHYYQSTLIVPLELTS